jgi:hypothetical protein
MPVQRCQHLAGPRIPEFDLSVAAAGSQRLPVSQAITAALADPAA